MSVQKHIIEEIKKNNGVITSKMLDQRGIARAHLKHLCNKGLIVRVARGVYTLPETWEDQFFNLQAQFKRGIYSGETVLYLCGLTDRTPHRQTMVFPTNYNLKDLKALGVKCFQEKRAYYNDGITSYRTPLGNLVRGYLIEKVLCDILKPRYQTDVQIITDAFKSYVKLKDTKYALLSAYAEKANVADKVRNYLEVLL